MILRSSYSAASGPRRCSRLILLTVLCASLFLVSLLAACGPVSTPAAAPTPVPPTATPTPPPPSPLVLVNSVNRVTANTGDGLTYTLSIANEGFITASGLMLTDTLPLSVTFVSATPGPSTCNLSSGQLICSLGTLAADASTQVTIQVTVASSGSGIITNTASASANEPDFNIPVTAIVKVLINPLRIVLPLVAR